ncbi:hypothetical protein C8F04DRAFT_1389234, partial [Mycena alexandri]
MPTPLFPYKCGSPGCNQKFEKLEHLHRHTKSSHSSPKPDTFKCGAVGCKAPSFPQLSLLHQHTAEVHPKFSKNTPSGPSLPKQEAFKCGVDGCKASSFPQLSLLHQHTAEAHPKPLPKPETFKCGVEGCKAPSFPQLSLLYQHTSEAHPKPLPKQATFKCGAEGCKAPSFPKLSLLHQHTAEAHSKISRNTPSGSPTPTFSTQGHPIPVTNTAPAPTSLGAKNAISGSEYVPAVFAPLGEILQRITQLELRQMLIDKSTLKVGI